MKGNTKVLIFSIICLVAGVVLLLVSGVRSGGDMTNALESVGAYSRAEEKSETVTQSFHSLELKTGSTDVEIYPSADGVCRLSYGETDWRTFRVSVSKDTLSIEEQVDDSRRSFHMYSEELPLVIYLPQVAYNSLDVQSSSGDISLQEQLTEALRLSSGSGDIDLTDVKTEDAVFSSSSGKISLTELQAESLELKTGSGDIDLKKCSLSRMELESNSGRMRLDGNRCEGAAVLHSGSGDIRLQDDRSGSYDISSSSGHVELRNAQCLGEARIKTGSGDVELKEADAASFDISTSSGDVKGSILTEKDFMLSSSSGNIRSDGGRRGAAECRVSTGSGDIDLQILGE